MAKKLDIDKIYSLSPLQEGMLYHYIMDKDSENIDTYYIQKIFEIEGELDVDAFESSLNKVIERHDILRTIFVYEKIQRPKQVVLKNRKIKINYEDISDMNKVDMNKFLDEFTIIDRKTKFDFSKDILLRVSIFKTGTKKYKLFFGNHHIILDGWCQGIIISEFISNYISEKTGQQISFVEETPYKSYIDWLEKQDKQDALNYWGKYLEGYEKNIVIPRNETTPKDGYVHKEIKYKVDSDIVSNLITLAKRNKVTINAVFQAIWGILLCKYNNLNDVVFGTVVSGRPSEIEGIETIVGLFINNVPVRLKYSKNDTFIDNINNIQNDTIKAQEFSYISLADIQSCSVLKQNLLNHIVVFENFPMDNIDEKDCGLVIKGSQVVEQINYDIGIIVEPGEEMYVRFKHNSLVYTENDIENIFNHLTNIMEQVAGNEDIKVKDIKVITSKEEEIISNYFNNSYAQYDKNTTIHELFERQVLKTPNNIAAIYGDEKITYDELNKKANKVAYLLKKNGITNGMTVAIMMERSIELVANLLGILKVGAAYLPIDNGLPEERINYMIKDSNASILLTNSDSIKNLSLSLINNFEDSENHKIIVTNKRKHIENFDALPIPNRNYINFKNYKNKIGMASVVNSISLQTTRGCPYKCIYCHKVWSKNHVYRSAESIFKEIEYYYKEGVVNFSIIDDCFNLNVENSSRLFKLIIENNLKIKIFFPNGLRGDILTPEYIDLMVLAGTCNINLSLETASPRLQKVVKKNLNIENFKKVIEYIATKHPNVILELATMHGFPSETEEEALMTLDFIKNIKWIHFPYVHILKVYPNTEMEELALECGISKEDIISSKDLAFHELPKTLPFSKAFTKKYQSMFLNEYFLNKDRLRHVLPIQMKILSEEAIIQKYNTYLPVEIGSIEELLKFLGMEELLGDMETITNEQNVPKIFEKGVIEDKANKDAKKILFLDLSQYFSDEDMLYKVSEQPLGQVYLMTYLKEKFKEKITGKVMKSGNDFDSYDELKSIVKEYNPDLIGIRSLTFYKEFFNKTVCLLRQWGINAPIVVGGPYGTSDYDTILKDKNVDLVVLGEGEETFSELLDEIFKNNFKLPDKETLINIKGIAFLENKHQVDNTKILLMDQVEEDILLDVYKNLDNDVKSYDLAYVMYTSGSTGKPKGVMIEHSQVNNCCNWMQSKFNLNEKEIVIQRTNLTFDPSVWEIFWPLCRGAITKILTKEESKDAEFLIKIMSGESGAKIMYCPSSLVSVINYVLNSKNVEQKLKLPYLVIGAESIDMNTVKSLYSYLDGKIVNTYGPTECTINNTYYEIEKDDNKTIVPIGKPVYNNQIYILSNELHNMPINVPGEICIAGDSLARGYVGNIEKTKEVFIENPFGKGKLYKTGDIGRWVADGNVEILGRVDEQIKIRGYRIELGEIKKALLKHNDVKDCVVVVDSNSTSNSRIKKCKKCGITSNYPSVKINNEGTCEICENLSTYKTYISKYFKDIQNLNDLIVETNKNNSTNYDCILLFNGGIGSIYALHKLVNMGVKVLTLTYNNGYLTKSQLKEIKDIALSINVDNVVLTHDKTDEILKESMKSAATVCKGCFHISHSLAAKYAYENNIKIVIGSTLSPGQIIENKLIKLYNQGIYEVNQIEKELKEIQKNIPIIEKNIFDLINIDVVSDTSVYDKVKFIDFYRYCNITNNEMISYLKSVYPNIENKKKCAIYSTNCSIKQIGDYGHIKEKGYHYYGNAISWEKRLGHILLDDVEKEIKCNVTKNGYENFKKIIGYYKTVNNKVNDRYICAYIVGTKELSASELRNHLINELPEYMIPSYFINITKIPLSINGKVNRELLPIPNKSMNTSVKYEGPRNEMDKMVINIWEEMLECNDIGINDNFFEIGGDSLKAIRVTSIISKEIDINIPLSEVFTRSTIKELSDYLMEIKGDNIKDKNQLDITKEIEKEVMLLNDIKDKKVFCFPDVIGHGVVFRNFSNVLNEYSVYAFNYLNCEDRIKKYVELIKNIDQVGPYVLIGYSAGSILAYEVAKELEKQKLKVSKVIVVDSYIRESKHEDVESDIKCLEEDILKELKNNYIDNPEILKNIVDRSKSFYNYFVNSKIDNQIESYVYMIKSSDKVNMNILSKWNEVTNGKYIEYNGYGSHNDMFKVGYVEKNTEVIRSILNSD